MLTKKDLIMQDKCLLPDFPVDIELSNIQDRKTPANIVLNIMQVFGFLIAAAAVLSLLFGPDSIWIDRSKGMTFLQFIQLYPGPIITIAIMILSMVTMMKTYVYSKMQTKLKEEIYNQLGLRNEDLPEGKELSFNIVNMVEGLARVQVDLVASDPDKNPTK